MADLSFITFFLLFSFYLLSIRVPLPRKKVFFKIKRTTRLNKLKVRILLGTTEGSGFGSTCGLVWRISGYGHEDGLVSRLRRDPG